MMMMSEMMSRPPHQTSHCYLCKHDKHSTTRLAIANRSRVSIRARPCKILVRSPHFAVSHTVSACKRSSGRWDPAPLGRGRGLIRFYRHVLSYQIWSLCVKPFGRTVVSFSYRDTKTINLAAFRADLAQTKLFQCSDDLDANAYAELMTNAC